MSDASKPSFVITPLAFVRSTILRKKRMASIVVKLSLLTWRAAVPCSRGTHISPTLAAGLVGTDQFPRRLFTASQCCREAELNERLPSQAGEPLALYCFHGIPAEEKFRSERDCRRRRTQQFQS